MRSIDALACRLDNLKKRLPQPDVEFVVYDWNDEGPEDGEEAILIDLVWASRALENDSLEEGA